MSILCKIAGVIPFLTCLSTYPAAIQVDHVIHVSIDGLRPDGVTTLTQEQVPNFYRLRREGAFTDNARTDVDFTYTLPNHTGMITGRRVLGPEGHNYTANSFPAPTVNLHENQEMIPYVSSVFDFVHDNGLSTALFASKTKFILYDQSYDSLNGAPDIVGTDDGRDKIDVYVNRANTADLVSEYRTAMEDFLFNYSFIHIRDPDSAGHGSGWISSAWFDAVKRADGYLGSLFDLVESTPALKNNCLIIITSDHGGTGFSHGDASNPLNYTIPFYVWGPGVLGGSDLYDVNIEGRKEPGVERTSYEDPVQPIRNLDAANLALDSLGLDPFPLTTAGVLKGAIMPIKVESLPQIVVGPANTDALSGTTVTLAVAAQGVGPLTYQWLKDNDPVLDATEAHLSIPNVALSHSGAYSVIVHNFNGQTVSSEAALNIYEPPTVRAKSDFNGDGFSDIVFSDSNGFLAIWQMIGGSRSTSGFLFPSQLRSVNWEITGSGDFNRDGEEDILFQHEDGTLALWLMSAIALRESVFPSPNHPGDGLWRVVGVGDLDTGGWVDLVFQHDDGMLAAWFMNGTHLVSARLLQPSHPGDENWRVRGLADFNGDTFEDLLFQHEDGRLAIWTMRGIELLKTIPLTPNRVENSQWIVVGVADFNLDEKPDLLFQNSNDTSLAVWLMNGTQLQESRFVTPFQSGGSWKAVLPK